ncbi:hypothetical protein EMCG_03895 [[Emmonsia] crescens]|uniref:NB-ARC domain-containing protein n=1 Tax=[Emmonsia] crescens TaxID=73230 RepID=A0A0G2IZK4_9EURO|nr:hypothetical protein EMCG_03895 [Emmonsia crescens UAMH 3008]
MPIGFQHLREIDLPNAGDLEGGYADAVDIVAIHGLHENPITAWIEPESGVLWLRDLVPLHIPKARILCFGYEASPSFYDDDRIVEKIQSLATTLVADLEGDRSLENCERRPIIFVCHGLGGVVVKKALAHSASSTSSLVAHLNDIFISTYAILFFGTPHDNINIANWLLLESLNASQVGSRRIKHSQSTAKAKSLSLETITNQFAPLMKKFHTFFFWEGMPTDFGEYVDFLVDQHSAAPGIYDAPKCAIVGATHSQMIKLTELSPSYRTVLSALKRYCRMAPTIILHRWKEADSAIARARVNEAQELTDFRFSLPDKITDLSTGEPSREETRNQYFFTRMLHSDNYIGRTGAYKIIRDAFLSTNISFSMQGQKRFVVHGIAGSGKSQMCTNFAYDNRECYWAVFTIDATSSRLAAESYSVIGKLGGLEGTESSGKYFLSQAREPWLLIIDNADSPDIDLPKLFPPGNRGHILVTTRNRDFQDFGNAGSIELGGLEEEEALYLLLRSARISTPWDISIETAGNEITKTLGYLALAVKQAGTAISQKLCNLTEYLGFYQYYRRKRQRGLAGFNKIPAKIGSSCQQEDIYSALDLSFEYLERKQTVESQDAIEILNIVSFYHFRNIRVDIFERALKNRQASAAPSTFREAIGRRIQPPRLLPRFLRQGSADTEPLYVKAVLRELYTCSLINYEEGDRSFYLHALVHTWARDRIHPSQRKLWAHIALNTLMEAVTLPSDKGEEIDTQPLREIIPHLDECLAASPVKVELFSSRLGRLGVLGANLILPTMSYILRGQALTAAKCGYLYAESGRFGQSAHLLSMVRDLTVQTLGYNNETTQKAMLFLADILWGLGQLTSCITVQSQVVEARKKHFGASHRETVQAMAKLGHSFWLNGQYAESLRLLEDTARTSTDALGPEDLDTLIALDYLGVTLGSWQRYEESKSLHERVLNARKHILGEANLETLTTMSNLAMALLDLEQREQARRIMHQVYEMRKEKLGKEHPYTLWALCYLSKVHAELGKLEEAEDMLVGGIAAGKRSLGDEHLGVLMGCGELARVYARQGRLDEAEELTISTLRRVKASRGSEHYDYIYGMWKLGQLYELQDKPDSALDAYQIAFENTETRLTQEHPFSKQIKTRIISLEGILHD